jgi:predicted nuclease of restriction endonuclease-like (RecB) superfamily
LELGKWFTFYARQKHIQTETSDFFIDLYFTIIISSVFWSSISKLISSDTKISVR